MYEQLMQLLPCGVYALTEELKIGYWNHAMGVLTGFSAQEMLDQQGNILKYHSISDNQTSLNILQCLTRQQGNRTESNTKATGLSRMVQVQKKDGNLRIVFLQARLIQDNIILPLPFKYLITLSDLSEEAFCELYDHHESSKSESQFYGIVGKNPKMLDIYNLSRLAAESNANVLITGESGTGKELVARAIHYASGRKHQPFITVNCSALTETLLESELFGHIKGSFTGAYKDKTGKFEAADKGTIFLDEIGDISPLIQLKLLRVLQEKTIERVGDNQPIKVDMRIITATNKNLWELVKKGLFREDLYYRLKVFPLHLVPLRERKNDLPLLCDHFIQQFNQQQQKRILGLTSNAKRLIMDYCWPGNIRELENALEYAFVLAQGEWLDAFDLPEELRSRPLKEELCKGKEDSSLQPNYLPGQVPESEPSYTEIISFPDQPAVATTQSTSQGLPKSKRKKLSKEELIEILEKNKGNKTETARELAISRVALWKKIKSLGIA